MIASEKKVLPKNLGCFQSYRKHLTVQETLIADKPNQDGMQNIRIALAACWAPCYVLVGVFTFAGVSEVVFNNFGEKASVTCVHFSSVVQVVILAPSSPLHHSIVTYTDTSTSSTTSTSASK